MCIFIAIVCIIGAFSILVIYKAIDKTYARLEEDHNNEMKFSQIIKGVINMNLNDMPIWMLIETLEYFNEEVIIESGKITHCIKKEAI